MSIKEAIKNVSFFYSKNWDLFIQDLDKEEYIEEKETVIKSLAVLKANGIPVEKALEKPEKIIVYNDDLPF